MGAHAVITATFLSGLEIPPISASSLTVSPRYQAMAAYRRPGDEIDVTCETVRFVLYSGSFVESTGPQVLLKETVASGAAAPISVILTNAEAVGRLINSTLSPGRRRNLAETKQ